MWKITGAIACCVALFATPVKAQIEEGDVVVVTKQSAELRVGTSPVAAVRVGQELLAQKIEKEWIWVSVELNGKGARGWIARDAVKFARKAGAAKAASPTVTEKKPSEASEAVRKTLKAYAEAFNKND